MPEPKIPPPPAAESVVAPSSYRPDPDRGIQLRAMLGHGRLDDRAFDTALQWGQMNEETNRWMDELDAIEKRVVRNPQDTLQSVRLLNQLVRQKAYGHNRYNDRINELVGEFLDRENKAVAAAAPGAVPPRTTAPKLFRSTHEVMRTVCESIERQMRAAVSEREGGDGNLVLTPRHYQEMLWAPEETGLALQLDRLAYSDSGALLSAFEARGVALRLRHRTDAVLAVFVREWAALVQLEKAMSALFQAHRTDLEGENNLLADLTQQEQLPQQQQQKWEDWTLDDDGNVEMGTTASTASPPKKRRCRAKSEFVPAAEAEQVRGETRDHRETLGYVQKTRLLGQASKVCKVMTEIFRQISVAAPSMRMLDAATLYVNKPQPWGDHRTVILAQAFVQLRRLLHVYAPTNLLKWANQSVGGNLSYTATFTAESLMRRLATGAGERDFFQRVQERDPLATVVVFARRTVPDRSGYIPPASRIVSVRLKDLPHERLPRNYALRHPGQWIYQSAAPLSLRQTTQSKPMIERLLVGYRAPASESLELEQLLADPLHHPDPLGAWIRTQLDDSQRQAHLLDLPADDAEAGWEFLNRLAVALNALDYSLDFEPEDKAGGEWLPLKSWAYLMLPRNICLQRGQTEGVKTVVRVDFDVARGPASRAVWEALHRDHSETMTDDVFAVSAPLALDATEAAQHLSCWLGPRVGLSEWALFACLTNGYERDADRGLPVMETIAWLDKPSPFFEALLHERYMEAHPIPQPQPTDGRKMNMRHERWAGRLSWLLQKGAPMMDWRTQDPRSVMGSNNALRPRFVRDWFGHLRPFMPLEPGGFVYVPALRPLEQLPPDPAPAAIFKQNLVMVSEAAALDTLLGLEWAVPWSRCMECHMKRDAKLVLCGVCEAAKIVRRRCCALFSNQRFGMDNSTLKGLWLAPAVGGAASAGSGLLELEHPEWYVHSSKRQEGLWKPRAFVHMPAGDKTMGGSSWTTRDILSGTFVMGQHLAAHLVRQWLHNRFGPEFAQSVVPADGMSVRLELPDPRDMSTTMRPPQVCPCERGHACRDGHLRNLNRGVGCYVVPDAVVAPMGFVIGGSDALPESVDTVVETPGVHHTYWYVSYDERESAGRSLWDPWACVWQFADRLSAVSPCRLVEVPVDYAEAPPVGRTAMEIEADEPALPSVRALRVAVPSQQVFRARRDRRAGMRYSVDTVLKTPAFRSYHFAGCAPLIYHRGGRDGKVRLRSVLAFLQDVETAGLLSELPASFLCHLVEQQCTDCCRHKTDGDDKGVRCLGLRLLPFLHPSPDSVRSPPVTVGDLCRKLQDREPTPQQVLLEILSSAVHVYGFGMMQHEHADQFLWEDGVPASAADKSYSSRTAQLVSGRSGERLLSVADAQFAYYFLRATEEWAYRRLTFRGLLETGDLLVLERGGGGGRSWHSMLRLNAVGYTQGATTYLVAQALDVPWHSIRVDTPCSEDGSAREYACVTACKRAVDAVGCTAHICSSYYRSVASFDDGPHPSLTRGLGDKLKDLCERCRGHICVSPRLVSDLASVIDQSVGEGCNALAETGCVDSFERPDWTPEACSQRSRLMRDFVDRQKGPGNADLLHTVVPLAADWDSAHGGSRTEATDTLRLATTWDFHLYSDPRHPHLHAPPTPQDSGAHSRVSRTLPSPADELLPAIGVGLVNTIRLGVQRLLSPLHLPNLLRRRQDSRYLLFLDTEDTDFMIRYLYWAVARTLVGQDGRFALLPVHPAYLLPLLGATAAGISPAELWLAMEATGQNQLTQDPAMRRCMLPNVDGLVESVFPGCHEDRWDTGAYRAQMAQAHANELALITRGAEALRRRLSFEDPNEWGSSRLQWLSVLRGLDPAVFAGFLFGCPERMLAPSADGMAEQLVRRMSFDKMDHRAGYSQVVAPHFLLHRQLYKEFVHLIPHGLKENVPIDSVLGKLKRPTLYYVWTRHPQTGRLFKLTAPMALMLWLMTDEQQPQAESPGVARSQRYFSAVGEMLGVNISRERARVLLKLPGPAAMAAFGEYYRRDMEPIRSFFCNYLSAETYYSRQPELIPLHDGPVPLAQMEEFLEGDERTWSTSVYLHLDTMGAVREARDVAQRLLVAQTCTQTLVLPDYLAGPLAMACDRLTSVEQLDGLAPQTYCFCGLQPDSSPLYAVHHGDGGLCTMLQDMELRGGGSFARRFIDSYVAPAVGSDSDDDSEDDGDDSDEDYTKVNPFAAYAKEPDQVQVYDFREISAIVYPDIESRMQILCEFRDNFQIQ